MPKEIEELPRFLTTEKAAAGNTVAAYRNDLGQLADRVLSSSGYEVLSAASMDSALELFRAKETSVDLVVTDIVMPGGSGTDLVEKLSSHREDLKVLYISGHPTEEVRRRGVLDSDNFLAKPFTPKTLLARVREMLDAG